MVINLRQQLYFLGAVSLKNGVINDKSVPAFFVGQRLHRCSNDLGGEQRCKAHPVDVRGIFETVYGVFSEDRSFAGLHVQKHAAIAKYQAEQVAHDDHDGHALLLVSIAFSQNFTQLIPLEKFLNSCRNLLPIFSSNAILFIVQALFLCV